MPEIDRDVVLAKLDMPRKSRLALARYQEMVAGPGIKPYTVTSPIVTLGDLADRCRGEITYERLTTLPGFGQVKAGGVIQALKKAGLVPA